MFTIELMCDADFLHSHGLYELRKNFTLQDMIDQYNKSKKQ